MTALPGYQGYLRNFQRDHIVGKDVPLRKYTDYEVETHGLMADQRWRSEHARRYDGPTFLAHQQAQASGTTRLNPSHKDSRQAQRIKDATQTVEVKEAWNWQQSGAQSFNGAFSSSLVPKAGRGRQVGTLYGTSYGDSIGVGTRPLSAPVQPKFPYPPSEFARTNDQLPALDSTLNQSLARAISSLPTADNILRGNVDLHGSYSRDFGHRGHHPLQRNAGHAGGPPVIDPSTITMSSAASTYARGSPSHHHIFPSSHLISPSGGKAGPSPLEGMNEYPHIGYTPQASMQDNPFMRTRDGVCDTATTREIFAGSTKSNLIRIPCYAGFIPASDNNALSLTGVQPQPSTKDNILQTYRHDKPGYSGHQPQCVANVRGPRTPRGMQRPKEGLIASLEDLMNHPQLMEQGEFEDARNNGNKTTSCRRPFHWSDWRFVQPWTKVVSA